MSAASFHSAEVSSESFIATQLAEAHPVLASWYGADGLRENFAEELRRSAAEAALRRRRPHDEIDPSAPRVIAIDRERAVVASLVGTDAQRDRFVRVLSRNFHLESRATIEAMGQAIAAALAPEAPEQALVYQATRAPLASSWDFDGDSSALARFPGVAPEKRFLAASIEELRYAGQAAAAPPIPGGIEIRSERVNSLDFYPRYSDEYDAFHTAQPDLRRVVPKEPIEDMRMFLEHGEIHELFIDGEWAGVFAVTPGLEVGLRGYKFKERLIAMKFRGRGLGPATLRAFINAIDAREQRVIYGKIHARNEPSYRSAIAFGRVDIGGWFWVPLK